METDPPLLLLLLRLRLNELATGCHGESNLIEIYQRAPNLIRRVARGQGTRRGGGRKVLPCWLIIVVDGCFPSEGGEGRNDGK